MLLAINEEVKSFRTVDKSKINSKADAASDITGSSARQLSFSSGNLFESLARTNPELFDTAKLKQLEFSDDLVRAFNEYFETITNKVDADYTDLVSKKGAEWLSTEEGISQYYQQFNGAYVGGFQRDWAKLIQEGMSQEDARKAVMESFCPESMSESGCRQLIKTRIQNNRILTDTLTKMLKMNYTALNISEAEATQLIEGLQSDETNAETIGKIKEFLKDPDKLSKFKSGNNYDFRSIGGGVVFLSNDASIQFSQHPSKRLADIFKYDAIVVGHGAYNDEYEVPTAKSIRDNNPSDIYEKIKSATANFIQILKGISAHNGFPEESKDTLNNIISQANQVSDTFNSDQMEKDIKERKYDGVKTAILSFTKILESCVKLAYSIEDEDIQETLSDTVFEFAAGLDEALNGIRNYQDPKQAFKDGTARKWVVQPIDTLTTSDNNTIIDVLRALKREGFKHVYVGACNPGDVSLPTDIRNDKDFVVEMGRASVYLEQNLDDFNLSILESNLNTVAKLYGSEYEFYTLNELYDELDNIYDQIPIHEGAWDVIKNIAKKAIQIIIGIWKRVIGFLKNLFEKIRAKIAKRFGDKREAKTKKPVQLSLIEVKDGKAKMVKYTANSPVEIQEQITKSNRTISDYIQYRSRFETQYIKTLQNKLSTYENKDKVQARSESTIFDNLYFI